MTRRVLRYEIPIDDQPHKIGRGRVLMAFPSRADRHPARSVEVWVEVVTPPMAARVQVFGTGQALPDGATWCASTVDLSLVWHVYQLHDVAHQARGSR